MSSYDSRDRLSIAVSNYQHKLGLIEAELAQLRKNLAVTEAQLNFSDTPVGKIPLPGGLHKLTELVGDAARLEGRFLTRLEIAYAEETEEVAP